MSIRSGSQIREVVDWGGSLSTEVSRAIHEMDGRYLRVVLLADGETVHNAFVDRSFAP